jgi:hypothetical protein
LAKPRPSTRNSRRRPAPARPQSKKSRCRNQLEFQKKGTHVFDHMFSDSLLTTKNFCVLRPRCFVAHGNDGNETWNVRAGESPRDAVPKFRRDFQESFVEVVRLEGVADDQTAHSHFVHRVEQLATLVRRIQTHLQQKGQRWAAGVKEGSIAKKCPILIVAHSPK